MEKSDPIQAAFFREYMTDPEELATIMADLSVPLSNRKKVRLIQKIIHASGRFITAENYPSYAVWLNEVIEKINLLETVRSENNAYFTHHDNIRDLVINLLKSAREELKICMFTISDNPIAETIAGCHAKGIRVRIITDDGKTFDKGSDIYSLHKIGVNIKIDSHKSLMHHKFVIVDNKKLLTGSYNWTRTGSDINNENILVTTNKKIVRAYKKEFKRLWLEMKPLPY